MLIGSQLVKKNHMFCGTQLPIPVLCSVFKIDSKISVWKQRQITWSGYVYSTPKITKVIWKTETFVCAVPVCVLLVDNPLTDVQKWAITEANVQGHCCDKICSIILLVSIYVSVWTLA